MGYPPPTKNQKKYTGVESHPALRQRCPQRFKAIRTSKSQFCKTKNKNKNENIITKFDDFIDKQ